MAEVVEPELNPNVNWLNGKGSWFFYITLLFVFYYLFLLVGISFGAAATTVNVVHTIVTFVLFHWLRGTPFPAFDEGKYLKYTFWEQIDHGRQNTPNRKFLISIPFVLFLISIHLNDYSSSTVLINFSALTLATIGKLPIMHKVRLFGINKLEK
eukprot:TRINITY_DN13224_c0_g1::TRINITY_DN13224_c0_g1_i1::g.12639::m.12639 TRINITY_DN13224_c0_g1::TRINITY_DN13224_c0_g1_i1::g.12639  ORF type:complete len:154 (+),score=20.37,sp/O42901/YBA9_SCHPO/41.67/2e-31,ORMDL/PF04061.9/1.2e-44,FixP_N/PF14715.1/5.6 TRINITY_DN13224_c0_g1_i1:108-569(+)